jgi:glutamine amidotransferase
VYRNVSPLAIEPELFTQVEGTTDSEVLLFLALTFGLADEPLPALERMSRYVPAVMPSLCASAVAWPRVLTSSLRRIAET